MSTIVGFVQQLPAQEDTELNHLLNQLKVELVQPGKISTKHFEFGTSISPNGKELFFTKGIVGFRNTVIVYSQWLDGCWSTPRIAPFSGKHKDMNPYFSKDGKRLYFTSERPTSNVSFQKSNLWFTKKLEKGWSQPRLMLKPLNDEYGIAYPTIDRNRNIHFVSWSRPNSHNGDIFFSRYDNGAYSSPERVNELNTEYSDADPEMSQDGKFMFIASTRTGGWGHYDLYIFVKQADNRWGKGINLGAKINSNAMDSDPSLGPDGKILYFSSDRLEEKKREFSDYQKLTESYDKVYNGLMNIYKVDISSLLEYLENKS